MTCKPAGQCFVGYLNEVRRGVTCGVRYAAEDYAIVPANIVSTYVFLRLCDCSQVVTRDWFGVARKIKGESLWFRSNGELCRSYQWGSGVSARAPERKKKKDQKNFQRSHTSGGPKSPRLRAWWNTLEIQVNKHYRE